MRRIRLIEPTHRATAEHVQRHDHSPNPGAVAKNPDTGATRDDFSPIRGDGPAPPAKDRSFPNPVRFAWEPVSPASGNVLYNLRISSDPEFTRPHVDRMVPASQYEEPNLHIGTRYFWKVVARGTNGSIAESPVWTFETPQHPPRWIRVPGITNVRDMGGWALPNGRSVRQGLLYRSSEMNSHVDITEEGRRVLLEDLKIRTDLDLRGGKEAFGPVLDPSLVQWVHIPIAPYKNITEESWSGGYRKIFALFAEPSNYPILFHCWGGADRGATVAFLLHALLGLSVSDLIRDYELTSLSIWGDRSRTSKEFQSLLQALQPFSKHPDDIHGQVRAYLQSIGVTGGEIAAIRDLLILE